MKFIMIATALIGNGCGEQVIMVWPSQPLSTDSCYTLQKHAAALPFARSAASVNSHASREHTSHRSGCCPGASSWNGHRPSAGLPTSSWNNFYRCNPNAGNFPGRHLSSSVAHDPTGCSHHFLPICHLDSASGCGGGWSCHHCRPLASAALARTHLPNGAWQ